MWSSTKEDEDLLLTCTPPSSFTSRLPLESGDIDNNLLTRSPTTNDDNKREDVQRDEQRSDEIGTSQATADVATTPSKKSLINKLQELNAVWNGPSEPSSPHRTTATTANRSDHARLACLIGSF